MRQNYLIVCLLLLSPYVLRAHSGHGSLEFVENRGQWKEPFLYKAAGGYGDVYLEENGFTFRLGAAENGSKASDFKHGRISTPPRLRFHVYRMRFVGARKPEQVTAGKLQPHYYNYFLGNDPARWKGEIHPAYNVDYKSLYQDIDLHLSSENTNLKYDLIVRPGADVSQIKLNYEGAQLSVKDNNLLVETSVGTVTEMAPYAYQYLDGKRVEVPCKYKLHGNTVSFVFPKGYDETRTLIIDPDIIFATFSGSVADNFGFTATYDAQGNFYAGGISFDQGYPVTTGAYDVTYNGGGSGGGNPNAEYDISISKFNPSGTALVYSTYIGGSDNEQPHSMIVDGGGNLIIAGRAYSGNYPTQNAFDNSIGGGADIIVTKFNAAGTALVGSTFYGGVNDDGVNINSSWNTANNAALKHSYADDSRSEVIVDNAGNIYVASCTRSSGLTGISGTLAGGQDGLVLKFNSNLSSVIGGSYIGGTGEDAAYVLALNNAQTMLYVGGGTTATAFAGGITAGSYGPAYKGGVADGFIARFQNAGAPVLNRATYVGSSAYDQVFGIQLVEVGA